MKTPEESSIIILAPARNVASVIIPQIETLKSAFKDFNRLAIHVVESHSSDNTIEVLDIIKQKNSNFSFETLTRSSSINETRTERISFARNKAKEYASHFSQKLDYVVVADVDGVNLGLTRESVSSNWTKQDWDMVSANQNNDYYDVWALRHNLICPDDCWVEYENLCRVMSKEKAFKIAVKSKMSKFKSLNGFIEVDSSFGGIAIYKSSIYFESEYQGISEDGSPICEHVPFNKMLRSKGARLFINTNFINNKSSTSYLSPTKKLKHYLVGSRNITNPREPNS